MQLTAAILPYAARLPGKKWPSAISQLTCVASQHVRAWATGHKKLPEGIFNGAQRQPKGWPPGMTGHKKPVYTADKACAEPCGLCQTGNDDFGVRTWL
ncbi:hypothetical protein [Pseudomonas anguilliseptica]|uniref:hypothetical protein n=1 Tax=Pseudomonas anguilliseptica TaxID=53406 RepID=UPI00325B1098